MTDPAGTPAPEGAQAEPTQAPVEAAPETALPGDAPTQAAPADASTPDVASELAQLRQMMQAQQAPAEPQGDLYDTLSPQAGGQQDVQPGQAPGEWDGGVDEYGDDEAAAQQAAFDQLVSERVTAAMAPTLQQMEADRRKEALGYLVEQHPDLQKAEVQKSIRETLGPLAQQYGMPHLATDPRLVEMVFMAGRAKAAHEVTPEQAAGQGAHLESDAGATAPGSEDPDAQFKRDLLSDLGGGVID